MESLFVNVFKCFLKYLKDVCVSVIGDALTAY